MPCDGNGDTFPRTFLPNDRLVNAAGTHSMAQHAEHRVANAQYESVTDAPPDDEETGLGEEDFQHVASVEEKKKLWRRNALINMSFIAAWYAVSLIV